MKNDELKKRIDATIKIPNKGSMSLDDLINHAAVFAKSHYNEFNTFHPMWVALSEDGAIYPITVALESGTDREKLIEFLREFFIEKKIIRFVSAVEAWYLSVAAKSREEAEKYAKEYEHGDVEKSAERKEAIFFHGEDHSGTYAFAMLEIHRDKDGHGSVDKMSEIEHGHLNESGEDKGVGGSFVGLLPRRVLQ